METVKKLLEKLGFKDVERFFDEKGKIDVDAEVTAHEAAREAVMREKLKPEISNAAKIAGEIGVFERLRKNMQPALEKLGKKLSDFPEEKQDLHALEFLLNAATKEPQKSATGDTDEAVKKANEKWQLQLIEKNKEIEALQAEVAAVPAKISEVETRFERNAATRSTIGGIKRARIIDDADVQRLIQQKLDEAGISFVKENGKMIPKKADGSIVSKSATELHTIESLLEELAEPYLAKSNAGNGIAGGVAATSKSTAAATGAPMLNGKEIELPEHLKSFQES